MPAVAKAKKKVSRRKPRDRTLFKRQRLKRNPDLMIVRTKGMMPLPRRLRTTLFCSIYGFQVGALAAAGQYYVLLNGINLPFNGGGWPAANPAILTTMPTGFSTILNASTYTSYRVLGATIRVEFLPQALTDTVQCCVTASTVANQPTNTAIAMTQPNTVKGLFSSSKNNTNGRLGNAIGMSITQHKLIGVRRQAIEDDLSGNYISSFNANPAVPLYYVVNWATPDAVNTAAALEYRIDIKYHVEVFDLAEANLPEV